MSFQEFSRLAEADTSYDRYLDKRQVEMAREGNCVLGSRLAIWLLEEADLRVYLTAKVEVRAVRIGKREGKEYEQALAETIDRDRRDRERYLKLYEIDNDHFEFADLLIDTEKYDVYEVADLIVKRAQTIGGSGTT